MELKAFAAQRRWLSEENLRLDATTYVSGGLQARDRILSGSWPSHPLSTLADVTRGPLHKRRFVTDPAHGVPYLTAADVALADPPRTVLLSRARTPELPILEVKSGWTLISSAGTIGKTTFVGEQLEHVAVSQDMLRVAPHEKISGGYLFAYLSTTWANAMICMRTYGSIVDRIEPKHIEDLPVPNPTEALRRQVESLVNDAAGARTEAACLLDEASDYFDSLAGPMPSGHDHAAAVGLVSRHQLDIRLDAFYHVGWAAESQLDGDQLGSFSDVSVPGRMRLVHARQGAEFYTGVDLYQVRPHATKRIARWLPGFDDLRIRAGTIMLQVDGQRYGLFGRPLYAGRRVEGAAASWHLARIQTDEPGRVFAFARSEIGRRAIVRRSFGTSVPSVTASGLAEVRIPRLPPDLIAKTNRAFALREKADADEEMAIQEVETWLGS